MQKKNNSSLCALCLWCKHICPTKENKLISGKPIYGKAITFNTTESIKIPIAWSPNSDASDNIIFRGKNGIRKIVTDGSVSTILNYTIKEKIEE